ncbi:MAG: DMT family transporter [Gluconacetobacter diazotrophicus]|nr:DMT family transporter [Gluconacetobacter diazotrophicus]
MRGAGNGWGQGLLGVAIFSGSLPATRVAVQAFDPVFLTVARAAIAGTLAAALLLAARQRLPGREQLRPLLFVAGGVVVGFPLLTALALRRVDAAHSIVFTGLLPLATAGFAVWRGGERADPRFWLCAGAGSLCVAGYALVQGAGRFGSGDALMLAAVVACGFGYAEGAVLARRLGGWQVICWALVLALPAICLAAAILPAPDWRAVGWRAAAGLGYVSVFSMLVGFVFWYRGLALGGTAAVGQLQLLQPLLALGIAAVLLREPVGLGLVGTMVAVLCCVAGARRFATRPPPVAPATV